ncbi:MAG: PPK2 family polyphosphate kinase [Acidimicrobiales bacterium]
MPSEHVQRWRVEGAAGLAWRDAASLAGAPGDRHTTEAATAQLVVRLAELQDRLWAESSRAVLVVLQGTDASGKDGTVKHVFTGVNPQGVRVVSFKEPSTREASHDFLWRVHAHAPGAGEIAIFNRSHYEDVLVARVHGLVAEHVWRARYDDIAAFEKLLEGAGTAIVKLFLHVSYEEQGRRLQARLDEPDKRWKLRQSDFAERERWADYESAYEDAITATTTRHAPWYVVPADHKWYRNWAVSEILVRVLDKLDPRYPEPPPVAPPNP